MYSHYGRRLYLLICGSDSRHSVTETFAGIVKCLARLRDELPFISVRMQGQLQDTKGVLVPDLGCWERGGKRAMAFASGSGDEFPDTSSVGLAIWILWREALV